MYAKYCPEHGLLNKTSYLARYAGRPFSCHLQSRPIWACVVCHHRSLIDSEHNIYILVSINSTHQLVVCLPLHTSVLASQSHRIMSPEYIMYEVEIYPT